MKSSRRSSTSFRKHLQVAEEWQIPDAKGYAMARTERVLRRLPVAGYEVNTLHTANGQTPFVTFGFGLGTSWESRLIQRSILKNRIAGLGKNRKTAVFPNWCSPSATASTTSTAIRTTTSNSWRWSASKRLYPGHPQLRSGGEGHRLVQTPMGCAASSAPTSRTAMVHDSRNNIGVISLNLPRIALEAMGDESLFWAAGSAPAAGEKGPDDAHRRLEGIKARVAPILYMEGRLRRGSRPTTTSPTSSTRPRLDFAGLHRPARDHQRALFGGENHVYDDGALRAKAVAIVARLRAPPSTHERLRPATASASTARRAKTCAIASAGWTPPISAWCRASPIRAITPTASTLTWRRRSIRTTAGLRSAYRRWPAAASSATANTRTCSIT